MKKKARFVAATMLGVALLLVVLNFCGQVGPELGADYAGSYFAGQILNSEPEHLYDLSTQERFYRRVVPEGSADQILPYPYAPFLALIFQPLALLPYAWSYLAWLLIGVVLSLAAFWLLWTANPELAGGDWLTAVLVALSFMPLLMEGWIGGQNSALLLFCVALAVYLHQRDYKVLAGVVIAFLAFKPTLPALFLLMLVVTRSWRVLLGVVLGGAGLFAVSIAAVGWSGCMQFLRLLAVFSEVRRLVPETIRTWKYVDFRAAISPVFSPLTLLSYTLLVAFVVVGAVLLWRTWRTADWRLAWASALAWTPVLSPHFAIYDTVLLIPAVMLAASKQATWLPPLVAVVYLTAWCSQPIARATGFQPLSAAIVLLGLCLCEERIQRWVTARR